MKTITKILLLSFAIFITQGAGAAVAADPAPYTKTLLIFDLNSPNKPSFNKFLQGKNVALVTQISNKKENRKITESEEFLTKVFNEYILVNKKALKKIDKNQDDIIEVNDPQFEQLALLQLSKNKEKGLKQKIEPLTKYGIRKIILNGKYISLNPEQRKRNQTYVAGVVILNDGTPREILDIVTSQQ